MKIPEHAPDLARIIELFESIPHCRELGMKVLELRYGYGRMSLPYDRCLIGNPSTGVVHGGVITAFLDTLSGLAVLSSVADHTPIATLDLRIDYLHPAVPGEDIFGSAECYKVTGSVAFARGIAYHSTFRDPIANATGTFMLSAGNFSADRMRTAE